MELLLYRLFRKKELCEQYRIAPEHKTSVIPLGFDLQKFQLNQQEKRAKTRQEFGIQEDEVAIAIIGRLSPVKIIRFSWR